MPNHGGTSASICTGLGHRLGTFTSTHGAPSKRAGSKAARFKVVEKSAVLANASAGDCNAGIALLLRRSIVPAACMAKVPPKSPPTGACCSLALAPDAATSGAGETIILNSTSLTASASSAATLSSFLSTPCKTPRGDSLAWPRCRGRCMRRHGIPNPPRRRPRGESRRRAMPAEEVGEDEAEAEEQPPPTGVLSTASSNAAPTTLAGLSDASSGVAALSGQHFGEDPSFRSPSSGPRALRRLTAPRHHEKAALRLLIARIDMR
mmetsp:Transcript_84216/g.180469  ORF Transcript_84216/g.180469 Transcript_84216/m.180469 type:complete len:264 (+) Transcript_84216:2122-2913(+)